MADSALQPTTLDNRKASARPWAMSRGYALLLAAPFAFLTVFFVWPLLRVLGRSVLEPSLGIGNYQHIFTQGPYLRVFLITLQTATTVTIICLLIGYPVAYAMARMRGRLLGFCFALVLIPLWTSIVIRTYAWMVLLQRRGVLNEFLVAAGVLEDPLRFLPSSLGVHIGMVHIMLPFMILPLVTTMRRIDTTLLQAAEILGASPTRVFLKVYLPLSAPGVNAGVILVFITSLGFFVTPALLGGPENMMAAVLIEQQVSQHLNWPLASALASALLVVTAAIYLVYARLMSSAVPMAVGR